MASLTLCQEQFYFLPVFYLMLLLVLFTTLFPFLWLRTGKLCTGVKQFSLFFFQQFQNHTGYSSSHQAAVSGWNSDLRCLSRRATSKIVYHFLGTRLQFQLLVLFAGLEKSAGWWGGVHCSNHSTVFFLYRFLSVCGGGEGFGEGYPNPWEGVV